MSTRVIKKVVRPAADPRDPVVKKASIPRNKPVEFAVDDDTTIVFGKYKGEPHSVLKDDVEYSLWYYHAMIDTHKTSPTLKYVEAFLSEMFPDDEESIPEETE